MCFYSLLSSDYGQVHDVDFIPLHLNSGKQWKICFAVHWRNEKLNDIHEMSVKNLKSHPIFYGEF